MVPSGCGKTTRLRLVAGRAGVLGVHPGGFLDGETRHRLEGQPMPESPNGRQGQPG